VSSTESRAERALRRESVADQAACELFEALAGGRLDALLLRGPAIARRLYGENERGYGDCDVLVPGAGRRAVEQELGSLGYAAVTTLGRAQHWRREQDGAQIDLHLTLWGVTGSPAALWEGMLGHSTTLELGGHVLPVPDLPATAVVIALHASQHGAVARNPLPDLRRALDRFDPGTWSEAAALAGEVGGLEAFRQGLSMLHEGRARLVSLGLDPGLSRQASLRAKGIRVPDYLFEGLTLGERLAIVRPRLTPSRAEIAALIDPRAADSHACLLAAHGRRVVRLPVRLARLGISWRRAG
jgi:hypothetical protein